MGALLLRSLDRADRVLDAMKCRGYAGRFYVLRHFHARASDAAIGAAGALAAVALAWLEWAA